MSLVVNLRHLESKSLDLKGTLTVEELGLDVKDDLIKTPHPLEYELDVQLLDSAVVACGSLELRLQCECARCLRPFEHKVSVPDYACHLPLSGEDAVAVHNDCVDLTPFLREDILLAFPQYPSCGSECRGIQQVLPAKPAEAGEDAQKGSATSAWAELDKLKF